MIKKTNNLFYKNRIDNELKENLPNWIEFYLRNVETLWTNWWMEPTDEALHKLNMKV